MMATRQTAAPTGRKKLAQGKERSDAALGHESQNTPSPEGATDSSELPKGWSWKSLADVAADGAPILYGILQPGPDMPGGIPYVRPTEIVEDVIDLSSIRRTTPAIAGKYKRSLLKADDIILSIVGTIGKVAVVPPDLDGGNITQSSVRVRPRPQVVLPRYVAWVLRSPVLRRQFDKHRLGTAVPRLNVAHVRALRFPVPPLPEQRRIVAEIEKQFTRLEAGVAALRRVQANLKRYRAAVLKAACEGRLVPTEAELHRKLKTKHSKLDTGAQLLARILAERRKDWAGRGNYKEPVAPDTANLPPLPEGWTWASPPQLSAAESYSLAIGPFGSNLKVSDYKDTGVPLTFVRNIRSANFSGERTVFVTAAKAAELKAHQASGGDILITKMGVPPGDACLYPETETDAVITADCIKWRLNPVLTAKRFFVNAINSEIVKPQIANITKGVAQMKVSLGRFESVAIPLPPLAEQTRIVAEVERRLSVVEELESVVSANLQRASRLRQSILQKAFTGELT